MINPSVGRVVWYEPGCESSLTRAPGEPLAAHVARVHNDRCVNLMVIDADGHCHPRQNVTLVQPEDVPPEDDAADFCYWMPFQVGQSRAVQEAQREVPEREVPSEPVLPEGSESVPG